MANAAYGLQFSRTLHGGAPVTKRFYVPSTDSTALFKGDVVELTSTGAMDPKGKVQTIVRATTGHVLLGVIAGFAADSSAILTGNYRAASTNRYVEVIVLSQADIGEMKNCALIVATGSTATGLSGTMVDSSEETASAADVKVIGIRDDEVNVGAGTATELEVMILAPAIKATDSLT